ncbi:MAG: family containing protein [Pedosphaera sp.]|nr:family containing protein [Pedosphaera sp.]
MKRREFLKTSVAAAGVGALASTLNLSAAEKNEAAGREFYELRLYHLRRGPKQKLFDDFFRDAAIPAFGRASIGPVGVFNISTGPDNPTMYVLISHKSMDSFVTLNERLLSDPEYVKVGAEFLNAPASDPAYLRVESSLSKAFEGVPKIEIPAAADGNKPRIFELRTYESHSKKANTKKIEMFNTGEIAIFRRAGLQPVFFSETLIGSRMPSLTYMLTFENSAAHDKNWAAFIADPEWKKLSTKPGYTDGEIVSNISNLFLRPASYSQI